MEILMSQNTDLKKFWDVLFDPEDWTCIHHNTYGTKSDPISKGYRAEHEFFVINPIQKNTTRSIKNVTKFRNFLFEIDKDLNENRVPMEVQRDIIRKSGLPISTIVFSGNKSLHWILSLEQPLEDAIEYRAVWKTIEEILNETAKDMDLHLKFDSNVKDPSRFSRCPGSVRMDTAKIQELKGARGRINNDVLYDWFESKGKNWSDKMPRTNNIGLHVYNMDSSVDERVSYIKKHLMKNMEYIQGNKNQYQFTYARLLRATGLTQDEVYSIFYKEFDKIDERKPIESAFSSNYDNDEKIYVYSKAEKIQYMKEREAAMMQQKANEIVKVIEEDTDGVIENGELADINNGGLSNYIRVGTKYYRADGYSIDVWDKQTIKDDFGNRALHDEALRKFRGFTNEPSYLKHIEYVTIIDDLGTPQSLYNRFIYPRWEMSKGAFPTIMKLLEKVFVGESENQLEIGLDWIQLLLTKPKQKLRALVLVGAHETGKDTFMEWLIDIVGSNGILIGGEELENNFNAGWMGKHLLCLNEVNYDLADKKTKEKIKNVLTAERITVEGKGENQYQIDNHTHVIMATNNMYDFMHIDSTENRFWPREMPKLKESDKQANFKELLKKEKPYFLYWITQERKLWKEKKDGRFWHSDNECYTEAGRRVVENTRSNLYDELIDLFQDAFRQENMRDMEVIYVRPSTLSIALNRKLQINERSKSYTQKAIKLCLLKDFNLRDFKSIRDDAFDNFSSSNNTFFEVNRSIWEN
jgi:hypothetical protein